MTRKLEIDMQAFPEGALGVECSASLEITIPRDLRTGDADALAVAVARALAAIWGIDPGDVKATVCLVNVTREVASYGDVAIPRRYPAGALATDPPPHLHTCHACRTQQPAQDKLATEDRRCIRCGSTEVYL